MHLGKKKHSKSWLVQLATGNKRKVNEVVEKFPLVMNGLVTCVYLNVIPLGSVGAWRIAGDNSKGFSPINVPN